MKRCWKLVGLLAVAFWANSAQAQPTLDVLWQRSGYYSNVSNLVFSPTGALIAFTRANTISLYQVTTRQVVREFTSPSGSSFSQIAFCADGAAIGATTGTDVVLFNVSDGSVLWTIALPNDASLSIAFSPDNRYVAVGSALRNRVYLLRRSDGTIVHEWARHTGAVGSVHFSPDGQRVVSSALDGLICLWRLDNFTLGAEYLIGAAGSHRVSALAPDGQMLAIAGFDDSTVRLVDINTGQTTATLQVPARAVSVAFTPDGQYVAACVALAHRNVFVWRVSNLEQLYPPYPPESPLIENTRLIAFFPDGRYWVEAGPNTQLPVRAFSTGAWVDNLVPFHNETPVVSFSPDSRTFYAASPRSGWVYEWDSRAGHPTAPSFRELAQIAVMAVSDRWLAISLYDWSAVLLRDRLTRAPWLLIPGSGDLSRAVWLVGFSLDGNRLYLAPWRRGIAIWRLLPDGALYEGALIGPSSGHVELSADRRYVVSYRANQLRVWDTLTSNIVAVRDNLPQFPYGLARLVFSPDSAWVAYAGYDSRTVYLWHWRENRALSLEIPAGSMNDVAFTPDSAYFGVASNRGKIIFWRTQDAQPIAEFTAPGIAAGRLVFSPDAKQLAIAQVDGGLTMARNPFYPDFNNDGQVDDADLLTVLFHFGASGDRVLGDANYDGIVDGADLLLVLFHFGM